MNPSLPKHTKQSTRSRRVNKREELGFLIPALVVVLVMSIFPLVSSLVLSLTRFQYSSSGLQLEWVGLSNYAGLLADARFWGGLGNTLIFVFVGVLFQYALGFGLALLLTQKLVGRRFFRVLFLIPMMITPVAVAYIMKMVLNFQIGPLAPIAKAVGLSELPWFADSNLSRLLVILGDTWQWTPFVLIVLLAGLEALPQEPYEAAQVDGATPSQMFWRLTFPMMLPVSSGVILIRLVESFKIIDMPIVLTGGGPGIATESTSLFAYYTYRNFELGKTAAIAYLLVIVVSVLASVFVNTVRKRALEVAG